MTNDEIRAMFREELGGVVVLVKDEIVRSRDEMHEEMGSFKSVVLEEMGSFKSVVLEEVGSFKSEMREEMGSFKSEMREEMGSFKSEVREEMGMAILASEARMIDHMNERLLPVNNKLGMVEARAAAIQKHVIEIKGDLVNVGRKVDQCTQVLDETTMKVADMQQSLFNLENKVDTYQTNVKREILRIDTALQALVQQLSDMNRHLSVHISTSAKQAHPDPGAAA